MKRLTDRRTGATISLSHERFTGRVIPKTRGVYLIHFLTPYRHAGHYIGYADDIRRRMKEHMAQAGARLIEVAIEAGHTEFALARVWKGASRKKERTLKNRGGASRLCPICQAQLSLF